MTLTNHVPRSLLTLVCLLVASPAIAELRVGSVCRVKGQEENTLQGLGLVVGLKGTGDADISPTIRALARTMQHMGTPVSKGPTGEDLYGELKNARNVALVFITATIPAEGAMQGSQVNCSINAVSAKSLSGGYLLTTPLLGPRPGNPRVYAFAQGQVSLDDPAKPTSGKIHAGCRLEETFENQFTKDGKFTLVINKSHASFSMAQEIERIINNLPTNRRGRSPGDTISRAAAGPNPLVSVDSLPRKIAKAIDQMHVEVQIPVFEQENSVSFISLVLNEPVYDRHAEPRVVINERTGAIVIGADVELGPVAVKHKNFVIEAVGATSVAPWAAVDSSTNNAATTKLKALVDALNALKVPSDDIIDIIKGLERSGDLYGKVIIE